MSSSLKSHSRLWRGDDIYCSVCVCAANLTLSFAMITHFLLLTPTKAVFQQPAACQSCNEILLMPLYGFLAGKSAPPSCKRSPAVPRLGRISFDNLGWWSRCLCSTRIGWGGCGMHAELVTGRASHWMNCMCLMEGCVERIVWVLTTMI